jgi:AraC family transcriptional regulator
MAAAAERAIRETRLTGGSFYGAIALRQNVNGAIFTELCHDRARKLPAHSHEMPFFCLFLGGDYGEQYGHRYMQFRPFTLSFRPAEVPHMDEVGSRGARMFGIEASRRWQDLVESASGKLSVAYDVQGGNQLWLALKLYREVRALPHPDQLQIDSLMAELLAATAGRDDRTHDAPSWLRRLLEKLQEEFCEPMALECLAWEARVHPVHLSRSFRKFTGYGLGEYVRRLRLRHACELMLEPHLALADISVAAGFADQSHFTRCCQAVTGITPGVLRSLVRDAGATSVATLCPRPS